MNPSLRIYAAGKIHAKCWRHDVVKDLGEHILNWKAGTYWPVIPEVIFGKHAYTGPYYRKVDKTAEGEGLKPHRLCLDAIDKSDMVFAWIDDVTCYATLFEMGYAHGKGIYTVAAYPKDFDKAELWFTTCCASDIIEASNPIMALQAAILRLPHNQPTLPPPETPTPHQVTVDNMTWPDPEETKL